MKKNNGLKVAREAKKISQKELAIKMNVDIQTELGKRYRRFVLRQFN